MESVTGEAKVFENFFDKFKKYHSERQQERAVKSRSRMGNTSTNMFQAEGAGIPGGKGYSSRVRMSETGGFDFKRKKYS